MLMLCACLSRTSAGNRWRHTPAGGAGEEGSR